MAAIILVCIPAAVFLFVLFFVVRAAVRDALNSHYKTVRLYEASGQWVPGMSGKGTPQTEAFPTFAPGAPPVK